MSPAKDASGGIFIPAKDAVRNLQPTIYVTIHVYEQDYLILKLCMVKYREAIKYVGGMFILKQKMPQRRLLTGHVCPFTACYSTNKQRQIQSFLMYLLSPDNVKETTLPLPHLC